MIGDQRICQLPWRLWRATSMKQGQQEREQCLLQAVGQIKIFNDNIYNT